MTVFSVGLMLPLGVGNKASAAAPSTIEVGEVRSLGTEVEVPVTLYDTTYLKSFNMTVGLPADNKGVTFKKFKPSGMFADDQFRTRTNEKAGKLVIDVISQTGKEIRLDKRVVVGTITYSLPASFSEGSSILLDVGNIVAKGRLDADISMETLRGKIERKMPVGDVVGNNKPNAAGAMRILQHVGGKAITERESFLSADVDGDGVLTQADAQAILDFVAGKKQSFIALKSKELDTAMLKSAYNENIVAVHGRAPYTYKKSLGTMPYGVTVNAETGEITGTPTRAGSYEFTVQVTDAVGQVATRIYQMEVADTDIVSVEKLLPINVKLGETPTLPSYVKVTYKDKSTGTEKVTWSPVDTSVIGTVIAKGKTETGFGVSVEVNVVPAAYILEFKSTFMQFLNLYTLELKTSPEVFSATVDGIPMHYEPGGIYSLGTTAFTQKQRITLQLKDRYGNVLETKQVTLD